MSHLLKLERDLKTLQENIKKAENAYKRSDNDDDENNFDRIYFAATVTDVKGGRLGSDEGPDNLMNDSEGPHSKWCSLYRDRGTIKFEFVTLIEFDAVGIKSANDEPARDPV